MKHDSFDVVVVGGGHAGCEAAHAASRIGAQTLLVTLKRDGIGVMSCNPAIGGLGKGHLVREIDALDGLMAQVADLAGIQFRLLNRRKGPAVQGPRAQADRDIYRSHMQAKLSVAPNLTIIEAEVVDLIDNGKTVSGVVLADGQEVFSKSVVLTTGTFLRGLIHIGNQSYPGGRMGDDPSVRLADRIRSYDLKFGRLKTGTPPRLNGRTIDWEGLEKQPGDDVPTMFSFLSDQPTARQVSCGIAHTNEKTHAIVKANLGQSAMYGGSIEGIGPRYCPSIEDKVVRFPDKASHQIFLEPEGLETDLVYPNGISTSLPQAVQEEYVNSIRGLERAEIVQPGYAIEYDYVDPRCLSASMRLKEIGGLYLAGQINGTTGYEEAAAQGLVAGLNAGRQALNHEPIVFSRTQSYLGVMISDLTTRGVTEPYRMFTSRAEYRLSLRADNADQRLTPIGIEAGLVSSKRQRVFEDKLERLDQARAILAGLDVTPKQASASGIRIKEDGRRRNGLELLAFPEVETEDLVPFSDDVAKIDDETRRQLEREAMYAHYVARQTVDIERLKRDEGLKIPTDFDYTSLAGLSNELCAKLASVKPESLAQAAMIEGMTPAALTLILARLKHLRSRGAA